jgi:hypothetical protein
MSGGSPRFVQFPHPGGEHVPTTDQMAWNTSNHLRKFLRAPGDYVDAEGHRATAELVFWGEWEAPSRVVRRWTASGRLPRAVHEPYWYRPTSGEFRQNTDPWVWGQRMVYSNCKQTMLAGHRTTSMQALPPGSLICFGSSIHDEFCVDTVFVVASAEPWAPEHVDDLDVDDAFKVCTAASLVTGGGVPAGLMLYRGATIDDAVEGMYSFTPARLAHDEDARFTRPPIRLPGLINPRSKQSANGANRALEPETVRSAWAQVREQVLAGGHLLAVHWATPPEHREGP